MKRAHYIAGDTHCTVTELVVVTATGRVTKRFRCPTTIRALAEVLKTVPRPRFLAFEEGPMADWLYRGLRPWVDDVTVCEPRRNHLIAHDGDHDDPIDAEKLAQLFRGGYVKRVHHPESLDRSVFKHHVGLYHDRVWHRVAEANRIMGYLRRYGVFVREKAFADPADRSELLSRLPKHPVARSDLKLLWSGYDAAVHQEAVVRRQLVRLARREEQIRRFTALPGVQWVRAATFFAYIDTPWRFKSKSALWRYLGIGLERWHSGNGPERLRVPSPMTVNRILKYTILGAAKSAIVTRDNPFADQYARYLHEGRSLQIARRNVARSLAVTMWGMWKNGNVYQPDRVGVAMSAGAVKPPGSDRRIMRGRRSSK